MATLLVPIDTSDIGAKVLSHAEKLGKQLGGARIVLLHVIEPMATYVPVGASMDIIVPPPTLETDQINISRARFEKMAAALRSSGADVRCEVVIGMAVDEIVNQAKTQNVDYIVLGSHGHGALFHLFSGSVVTGVLKHSTCPVIVVPARG